MSHPLPKSPLVPRRRRSVGFYTAPPSTLEGVPEAVVDPRSVVGHPYYCPEQVPTASEDGTPTAVDVALDAAWLMHRRERLLAADLTTVSPARVALTLRCSIAV